MHGRVALLPGTRADDPSYSRSLPELARVLAARGWQARVFCPETENPRALESFRPDLVNLHFAGHLRPRARAWLLRAWRGGTALVTTFQDLDHPDLPPASARERAQIAALLAASAAVTALTPKLSREVRGRFPAVRRVAAIGNAVPKRWFSPEGRRDGPIVAVGRLAPYKGIDLLLWAFAEFVEKNPAARLAVFGKDFSRGRHRRLAELLGLAKRVRFHDHVGEARLRRALASTPLFVSPSRSETYGMAVLEAMAAGAPVLASRVGSAGLLARHRRTAWLTPPGNPRALVRGMRALMEDAGLRRRLGRAGRRLARRHTWEARARNYERIFRKALDGR